MLQDLTPFLTSDLMHLETSARTGENVEESFLKCARAILTKIESGLLDVVVHADCRPTGPNEAQQRGAGGRPVVPRGPGRRGRTVVLLLGLVAVYLSLVPGPR